MHKHNWVGFVLTLWPADIANLFEELSLSHCHRQRTQCVLYRAGTDKIPRIKYPQWSQMYG